ncbi:hypothetical protein STCU_05747 [Strigomonas culicis]|uniref:Uncharacterized protein n=1 Tax=Strigomonas culicis TaxID=28005 RepID=S9VK22_9TRYP|nr:hypothetical protein STCU_05747 [Strigomonas culicis]|eukprot:EPY27446.1 hypothetical protein STCU_05747 [Strigomonas culicis]
MLQNAPADPKEQEEETPLLARLVNHLLTPGSSLTPLMWAIFNVIMFGLFMVWCSFVYSVPHNIHVWIFGVLGLGLALSTNWLMYILFTSGLDFASLQEKEREEREKKEQEQVAQEKKNE